MFGHQNDDNQHQNGNIALPPEPPHDGILGDDNPAAPPDDQPQPPSHPPAVAPDDVGAPAPAVPHSDDHDSAPVKPDDLLDIKQQALQQLSPLVGHLDQTPEEKFRTTMMMIQASDNQALVKDAYEAAKQISDEKTRAQALLDIVNEINYFTQHAKD